MVLAVVIGLPLVFVVEEAIRTLVILRDVEHERDSWQRPDDVLRELDLRPGATIVDLGSGVGYFALKMAPRVAPGGRVFAVDLRRESLTFLWIRARLTWQNNLHVIVGAVDDPRLPLSPPTDAALIANTFHELTAPAPVLDALSRAMRPGARLVVLDRGPRGGATAGSAHEITSAAAERVITARGFQLVRREDPFIDRGGEEEVWWLMTFRRP
jgi:SAM-dependent methyltransferase